MKSVVITSATRTAVGAYLKSLRTVPPEVLAARVITDVISRCGIENSQVDNVILGNVLSLQPNIARVSTLLAHLNEETPAYTVNRLCASSLQAVINAYQSIATEETSIVIAGGTESLSRAPYKMPDNIRFDGIKSDNMEVIDSFQFASSNAQPQSIYPNTNMGITAENIAKRYNITREEQDLFALKSQKKHDSAARNGVFTNEIVPVSVFAQGKEYIFSADEHPHPNITIEKLSKLQPSFLSEGTVTSGNSCGLNDGASAVIMMNEATATKYDLNPLVRIVSYAVKGINPLIMGLGVVPSLQTALDSASLVLSDIDLIEINEAFAAQVIGCFHELGIYENKKMLERVNICGGAIAHGHALANSGTRMLTTLIYNLKRLNKRYGLVSMCVGGGQGVSIIVENYVL